MGTVSGVVCTRYESPLLWAGFEFPQDGVVVGAVCAALGLTQPKVFYEGGLTKTMVDSLVSKIDKDTCEGFVIRPVTSVPLAEFSKVFLKWVRPNHVQTDAHWTKQWVKNTLAK